ncbi:hypothetical protein BKI52_27590 [marine bacterium AO1-C]|nr:hypothetical protein BKI52_27590 [marine bacterium AO1-C]
MRKIPILTLVCCLLWFAGYGQDRYYYAFNKKVYLKASTTKMLVRFKTPKEGFQIDQMTQRTKLKYEAKSLDFTHKTYMVNLKDQAAMQSFQSSLGEEPASIQPVYLSQDGLEVGVTNEIMVRFKDGVDPIKMIGLHKALGVKVKKIAVNYVLLEVPAKADVFSMANYYQESGLAVYSHPNFIMKLQKTAYIPNDSYFNKQFYLHNTGQTINDGRSGTADADVDAPEAWDITKGNSNIVVAVIDEGVTSNHPDLPNSRQVRLNGSNFASSVDGTSANDPSPTGNGNHGNACAGIIGATQDNNQGVTGVAPNVKIMPIRIPFGGGGSNLLVDAVNFAWQNGADIISNSWGYGTTNPNFVPALVQAFQDATTQGRNGKGSVVLIAAGNTANQDGGNSGTVNFPANINVSGVITVGSSDRFDKQSDYSPTSNPSSSNNQIVDLVAPSHRDYSEGGGGHRGFEVWTIDIPGTPGYNSAQNNETLPSSGTNNLAYTGRMGGTSAATPLAAGIAALVLSIDADLTQQEVFNILTQSADDVGGYNYVNGVSNEMGHGRVNAFKAVQQAQGSGNNCGTPGNVASANVTQNAATVSWNAVSGATQYTVRYRVSGTSSWTTANAGTQTSYSISGLSSNTTYEVQVSATCASGTSPYSASINFTTGGVVQPTYCSSQGTNVSYEYINSVAIGSINNTSQSDNGYGDYTSLSTNLTAGGSASITITPGFPRGSSYNESYKVWIDFNRDGDFADAGEEVFSQSSSSAVSGSISIPAGAVSGTTRMRVSMRYNSAPASCGNFTYGEVEDYSVNITGGSGISSANTQTGPVTESQTNPQIVEASFDLNTYPNPTTKEVNVNLQMSEETEVSIAIINLKGQQVMSKNTKIARAGLTERLEVGHLKKGIYLMTIRAKNGYQKTHKIVIK